MHLITYAVVTFLWCVGLTSANFATLMATFGKLENLHMEYYEGCVTRNNAPIQDDFPQHVEIPHNSIETCIAHCNMFTFAGLENGTSCYCGDTYNAVSAIGCYNSELVRCPGDENEVCGGRDGAVSVYRVCPIGYWGLQCERPCPGWCMDHGCHVQNGSCVAQCRAGKTGKDCWHACGRTSTLAYYGPDCMAEKRTCLNHNVDPVLGYCVDGCLFPDLDYGPFCFAQPLSPENPEGSCPRCAHCKDSICPGTGEPAYYDCPHNWLGTNCTDCRLGTWGTHCEKICLPESCLECGRYTGKCTLYENDYTHIKLLAIFATIIGELLIGAVIFYIVMRRYDINRFFSKRGQNLSLIRFDDYPGANSELMTGSREEESTV